jgi:hypothetical protein
MFVTTKQSERKQKYALKGGRGAGLRMRTVLSSLIQDLNLFYFFAALGLNSGDLRLATQALSHLSHKALFCVEYV